MNIGIFVARWPPGHLGGAELQAARMARELAARGHRVHVFTRSEAGRPPEITPGVTVHGRDTLPIAGIRLAGEVLNCLRQARRARTDVNLCYITLNSGLLGYAVRRAYGTPFVIALCGLEEALPLPLSWRKRLERFLQMRADGVWMQSSGLLDLVKEGWERDGHADTWRRMATRMHVISNGLDLPEPRACDAPPPRRFVFVGRLVEEKSLPTLIEAARQLPDAEVQLVGDGPLSAALQRSARGTRIEFLGRRSHDQLPGLLRQSRGLVLCSRTEGLPNVVLEALSHGRPVIATPVGAIPELIQDGVNGRLVAVNAPDALAAAMRELMDDAIWSRLAAASRPSVERFAWPLIVRAVEGALAETVEASGPRSQGPAR
jgi:glycosyltransferase involved in cell wall biosynthesis